MSSAETLSEAEGRLVFRRTFSQSPDIVWPYLVEDEKRRSWLCGGAVDPEEGGRIEFKFDPEDFGSDRPESVAESAYTADFEGKVIHYDPPHRLAFTWPSAPGFEDTLITIELDRADEGGTNLTLTHERIGRRSDMVGSAAGWHTHLELLECRLSRRMLPNFFQRHDALEDDYKVRLEALRNEKGA